MWKILTAQIGEKTYYSLTSRGLFPGEQKGCPKGSRDTAELLYIDQHILNESKTSRKNLAMVWIHYKKAYDMVPQSWILHCLKMFKISHEVINFIEKTMQTWRVDLTAGGRSLAETKMQRGIFQGDRLSPLLFIIAMMPLNHILRIYSQDIGMEFRIEKCAMLVMKTGKGHMTDGMELPNYDKFRMLGENETSNIWVSWRLTPSNKSKWKTRSE